MSTNNNPGQLSPDGHWVWNGTEWTPVQPNVMATASDAPMAQPAKKGLGRGAKIGIGVGAALLALFAIGSLSGGGSDDTTATPATSAADPTPQDTPTPAVEDTPTPEETAEVEATPAEVEEPTFTVAQENAIETAQNYIALTAFSKSGLIGQLKFEGYTMAEAKFAVEHLDIDWNKQAAKKAEEYLNTGSFSRSGLIDQLEFEGFTRKQAEYGAESAGL